MLARLQSTILTLTRGYKKAAIKAPQNDFTNLFYIHIDLFLKLLCNDLQTCYKIYLDFNRSALLIANLELKLSELEQTKKRYLNAKLTDKLEEFYTLNDHLDIEIYNLLLYMESFYIDAAEFKKHRPTLRQFYIRSKLLNDFNRIFRYQLRKSLEQHSDQFATKNTDYLQLEVDLNLIILQELNITAIQSKESAKKSITFLNDALSETKWLINDQKSNKANLVDPFFMLATVHKQFPKLHGWITYEFIHVGDVFMALVNTALAIESIIKTLLANTMHIKVKLDKNCGFNSLSKYIYNTKQNFNGKKYK